MIDSHCHVGFEDENVTDILSRAQNVGVTRILSVACSVSDYPALTKLLNDYPIVYGAFGIHPEYADTLPSDSDFINMINVHPHLVAVGECGLDYHYLPDTKEIQRSAFERQIELAFRLNKPLIIHTREADSDTLSILESADRAGLLKFGGVLHCFTGSQTLADKALDLGFYISASGVITFKAAEEIRAVFRTIPVDRLLIETDSPYMAPVPFRGQKNEPSFVVHTAEKLAELKSLSLQEIDTITTHNFYKLFRIKEATDAN